MTWPLAVIGFARPWYLEQTLKAVLRQEGAERPEPIGLFCDGAVNPKSQERYASEAEVMMTIAVFRRLCPKGEVFDSSVNLGIAANIDRAERWLFDELKTEAGIIFEDDLVTTPHYLTALYEMIDLALDDERIGYVACYGADHLMPLGYQQQDPTEYLPLEHNWGFALTRRQYLKSKPYVDDYLDLISESDYLRPNLKAIYALLASWGMGTLLPAQDVVRAAICCRTQSVRLNTRAVMGKYIGKDGTHHNPSTYNGRRYGDAVVYPDPVIGFLPLSDEKYQEFRDRQDNWLRWSLTPQAKQWMVGIGLAERNWPEFFPECGEGGIISNLDRFGRRRI